MTWMQIAIKPAKPFAFGTLGGMPIFGLPGNPVSSLVSFELLARPALRRMMGHRHVARPSVVGVTDVDLRRQPDGKVHFLRVNGEFADDGRYHVRPVGAQGSHQLAATALADALVVLPDGDGVPAGADVAVLICSTLGARSGGRVGCRGCDRSRRSVRARHPRPADLGHRPLQLPLHVLHAGGGHDSGCRAARS